MPITWSEKTSRWFNDASEYTGYDKKLAQLLLERIDHRDSLCDLGCGLSFADMELSRYINQITCVDADGFAIEQTRRRARELKIDNITAFCGDARQFSGIFDTVMCLFHGNIEDYVQRYLRMARYKFIAAVHDDPDELVRTGINRSRKLTSLRETAASLEEQGLKYTMEKFSLEFGQPFINMDEARDFVIEYKKNEPGESADDFLSRNLTTVTEGRFPYYLPRQRKFGIFVIEI
jgi:SAM-dependent methyltransferase